MYVAELSAVDIGAYVEITDGKATRRGVIQSITHNGQKQVSRVKLAVRDRHSYVAIGYTREHFEKAPKVHVDSAISDDEHSHPNAKNWNFDAVIIDYSPPK